MRPKLSVVTLFRSPLKTLVTFVLLAATSFAFVSRGMEYAATNRMISNVEEHYTAVGTLVCTERKYLDFFSADPSILKALYGDAYMDALQYYCPIDNEARDLVLSSEYVKGGGVRHVAGGIIPEGQQNATEPAARSAEEDLWLDCAVVEVKCLAGPKVVREVDGVEQVTYGLTFYEVERLIAGDAELYPEGVTPKFEVREWGNVPAMAEPEYTFALTGFSGDGEYDSIETGRRYLMVLEPYPGTSIENGSCLMQDSTCVPPWPWTLPFRLVDLTEQEEQTGSDDYSAYLDNDFVRMMDRNQHTQELVYTSDMSLLPRFHDGSLYISDGRMISPEDAGRVCVINAEYAERNGLGVGDTITFDVEPDTMGYGGEVLAREAYYPDAYFSLGAPRTEYGFEPKSVTYEVVGIWSEPPREDGAAASGADTDALRYMRNTVFVPEETYPWPSETEPLCFPSTFGFELRSPGDVTAIESELGDGLEALGYKLLIDDMGYAGIDGTLRTMRTGALIGFIAMAAALLLSLALTAYLFILRRKNEYGIMRALGVPSRGANRSLLIGLFVLGVSATAVGCAAAMLTMRSIVTDIALKLAEATGGAISVSVSPLSALPYGAGVLALLLVFAEAGLRQIGRRPPLALLQGGK